MHAHALAGHQATSKLRRLPRYLEKSRPPLARVAELGLACDARSPVPIFISTSHIE